MKIKKIILGSLILSSIIGLGTVSISCGQPNDKRVDALITEAQSLGEKANPILEELKEQKKQIDIYDNLTKNEKKLVDSVILAIYDGTIFDMLLDGLEKTITTYNGSNFLDIYNKSLDDVAIKLGAKSFHELVTVAVSLIDNVVDSEIENNNNGIKTKDIDDLFDGFSDGTNFKELEDVLKNLKVEELTEISKTIKPIFDTLKTVIRAQVETIKEEAKKKGLSKTFNETVKNKLNVLEKELNKVK
ncbi:hypothetical protein [Mycoplasma crocodyli]|uniref:Putative lipoprotein n=1 Tax=Mycoplasma crocodyli (strain ATCC 51981 / MP145) TaxID=512564 RepID=D5E4N4_MYCCM|nr:hypothetical protein [Mycoplasma crocodyli]ADE19442.1 putative lipoprotein [Mycoplasma crocodyli MP145]